jgi:hypothetical protein
VPTLLASMPMLHIIRARSSALVRASVPVP